MPYGFVNRGRPHRRSTCISWAGALFVRKCVAPLLGPYRHKKPKTVVSFTLFVHQFFIWCTLDSYFCTLSVVDSAAPPPPIGREVYEAVCFCCLVCKAEWLISLLHGVLCGRRWGVGECGCIGCTIRPLPPQEIKALQPKLQSTRWKLKASIEKKPPDLGKLGRELHDAHSELTEAFRLSVTLFETPIQTNTHTHIYI